MHNLFYIAVLLCLLSILFTVYKSRENYCPKTEKCIEERSCNCYGFNFCNDSWLYSN